MAKNIVIIYSGDDWKKEIPISNEGTRLAIQDWMKRAEIAGVNLFRASIKWYDLENNVFKKAWAFKNGSWLKIEQGIKPDLIYDKVLSKYDYPLLDLKMQIAKQVQLFNSPLFRTTFNNKLSQYVMFGEYMPSSYVANNQEELDRVIKNIAGEKVVVKPLYGTGGFGIYIGDKEKASAQTYDYPVLAQQFILSQKGIPGVSLQDEVADLRLVFCNNKLTYALSRVAKNGSLFTNLHQGASGRMVQIEKIPAKILEIVAKINKQIAVFSGAQYSLDFIFDNAGNPYFIEMNTCPGIDLVTFLGDERTKQENFDSIICLLK